MLCDDCKERKKCINLCAEAEQYVDQDYVKLAEVPLAKVEFAKYGDLSQWAEKLVPNIHLTPKEAQIVTLLGLKLSRSDICQLLDITREALRKHIQRLRKKMSRYTP